MRNQMLRFTALLALAMFSAGTATAIMVQSTGDPSYNTNAPHGSVAEAGWNYQGQITYFLGTPIAPTFVIVAKHIGAAVNMDFTFDQRTYKVIRTFDCPNADLRVLQVDQTFAHYAPLYSNTNETGQHCVVFGRGTERGNPIVANGITNGWLWGAATGIERWGENDVHSIETDPDLGDFLYCTFDRQGGPNECMMSSGDSSGAVFIQDGGQWKLAGINYGVDGPYSTDGTTNTQFIAAFLNARGYYGFDGTNWFKIATPTPSGFYSSRISAHADWIRGVINDLPGNDFHFTGAARSGSDLELTLLTAPGRQYRVDYATNLDAPSWQSLSVVDAAGTNSIVVDARAASLSTQRFYRLMLLK